MTTADSTEPVVVEMPGPPQGKGRARSRPGGGRPYTPKNTRLYEASIGYLGRRAMQGRALLRGPLRLKVKATFPVPKSWSQRKRADAFGQLIRPTKRPDFDNLAKVIDGLKDIVFRDDAFVVEANISKRYGVGEGLLQLILAPIEGERGCTES